MPVAARNGSDNRQGRRRPVGRLAEVILRQVWSIHLRRSGFEDLETSDNPWAPLSRATGKHKEGPENDGVPGDAATITPTPHSFELAADIADHFRRMEHMSGRFEDGVDRQIGVALSDGVSQLRIKADLRVGQTRIERVAKQLRIWMREPKEDEHGTE
jgi:hypothetical protein